MDRFMFVLMALGVAALAALPVAAGAEAGPPAAGGKVLKAVVHVNFADAERQGHGLKNIENMLKAEGGKATVEVVCHGPGIGLVLKGRTKYAEKIESLMKQGVRFDACENTLREKSIPREDLLPGVTPVPSGAVQVVRRQQEGYGYFRP